MRLYKNIARQLKENIRQGIYPVGSALPPERELAKQLNVSRTSIREAIIALEIQGWVQVKLGSGIYVQMAEEEKIPHIQTAIDPDIAPYLNEEEEISPFSLLHARLLIEPEAAALAAENMSEQDLSQIQDAYLLNVRDNFDGSTIHIGDRLFHIRIAEASGNDAYAAILRIFLGHGYGAMFSRLQHFFTPQDMPLRSQAEHLAILIALQKRNPNEAREAMRLHIQNVIDTFLFNQKRFQKDEENS